MLIESIIAIERKLSVAKNFPRTTCKTLIGQVRRSSSVFAFFSSAQLLIVIAGTNRRKIHGNSEK
jgi:hypothetical protein